MADTPVKHDSNEDIDEGQLFIFVSKKPMAYGISANLSVGSEEKDTSNKMVSGGWKSFKPGMKNWSLSSESLVTWKTGQLSAETLLDIQIEGGIVDIVYGKALVSEQTLTGGIFEPDLSETHYTGQAYITSFDVNSTNGDTTKCSVTLTGSGALDKGTIVPKPEGRSIQEESKDAPKEPAKK